MHKSIPPQMQVRWWKSQAGGNSQGASGGSRTAGTTLRPNTNLKLNPNFTISPQKKKSKEKSTTYRWREWWWGRCRGPSRRRCWQRTWQSACTKRRWQRRRWWRTIERRWWSRFCEWRTSGVRGSRASSGTAERLRTPRHFSGTVGSTSLLSKSDDHELEEMMNWNWRMDSLQENEGNSSPKEVRRTGAVRCFAMRPVYTCEIQAVNSTSDTWRCQNVLDVSRSWGKVLVKHHFFIFLFRPKTIFLVLSHQFFWPVCN